MVNTHSNPAASEQGGVSAARGETLPHPRWPSASLAADRRSRRQRPPLAPPTSPSAPPRLPRPPHRATLRRKPYNAAFALVFNLGHPSHLRSIRRRQDLPELADPLSNSAVSSSSFPPSPRALLAPVAAVSTAPESSSPLAMSPSWLRPCKHASERLIVLSAAPGTRSHPQFSLPCIIASKPTSPELRPPPRARFRRARSSPAPPIAPLDAHEPQLRVARLRRRFGHRRTKSEALRRLGPRRRRAAGELTQFDPWVGPGRPRP